VELGLPSQARDAFDKAVEPFLLKLKPAPPQEQYSQVASEQEQVTPTLTVKDFSNIRWVWLTDGFGAKRGRVFDTPSGRFGLLFDDFDDIRRRIQDFAQHSSIRDMLSVDFLTSVVFEWLEKRHKNQIPKEISPTAFLAQKAEEAVVRRTVGICMTHLALDEPVVIGQVTFEFLSQDTINRWETASKAAGHYPEAQVSAAYARFRKQFQGTVLATMTIKAEKERAIELLHQEADKALTVLRFFSHSALMPELPAYFGKLGHVLVPRSTLVWWTDQGGPTSSERLESPEGYVCTFHKGDWPKIEKLGAGRASELLRKPKRTRFEDTVFDAMSLYARAVASTAIEEKIVFVTVALETLLLKNTSEPVQGALALRLAHLVAKDVPSRRAVMKNLKEAYGLRSSFVHHGRKDVDFEVLSLFSRSVCEAIRSALLATDRLSTKEELIEELETQALS
jgi:hypothetical protein